MELLWGASPTQAKMPACPLQSEKSARCVFFLSVCHSVPAKSYLARGGGGGVCGRGHWSLLCPQEVGVVGDDGEHLCTALQHKRSQSGLQSK